MGTKDFTDKFKNLKLKENKDINVLLLGESGVGKSTFINSIANYLHFNKLKHAESAPELQVLIPSTIEMTTPTLEQITIRVGDADKNETQETGRSATQDVKTYVFPVGEGKTRLRLIDTPGMLDDRGIDQDETNCENILSYLSHLQDLHAICFLLRPSTTRVTAVFEYCIKQLLSRLEKSAVRNIIFIFTNTRGTNYAPSGETYACLKRVIDDIQAKPPHVTIPFGAENVFSFDNEAFRFLVAVRNNVKYDDDIRKLFVESWKTSTKECWRMISYIVGDVSRDGLRPHQIQNTMSINEARRLIVQLSQPLVDISQLINDNIRILSRHEQNLQMDNQGLNELKNKLYMPIIDLEVTKLTQPATVCTTRKCAEYYKVGDLTKWHYKQRCHDPCHLTQVTKELIGDPGLVHCAAMRGTTCTKCTCEFNVHMHIYYFTKTVDNRVVDNTVQNNVTTKERAIQESKQLIEQIKTRKRELEEEKGIIINNTAQFAFFLQQNAISPYNDAYKSYIEYLIHRELSAGRDADKEQIYHLQDLIDRHDKIKEAFEKSLKFKEQMGEKCEVTPQTIMDSIHKMYKLKNSGKKIKELLKTQKESRQKEYDDSYVHHKSANFKATSDNETKKQKKAKNKSEKGTTDDERKQRKGKKSDKDTTDDERRKEKGGKSAQFRRPPPKYDNNQQRQHQHHNKQQARPPYAHSNRPPPVQDFIPPLLTVSLDLQKVGAQQRDAHYRDSRPTQPRHNDYKPPTEYYNQYGDSYDRRDYDSRGPPPPHDYSRSDYVYDRPGPPPPHDYRPGPPPPRDYRPGPPPPRDYRPGPPPSHDYRSGGLPPPHDYRRPGPPPDYYGSDSHYDYNQRPAHQAHDNNYTGRGGAEYRQNYQRRGSSGGGGHLPSYSDVEKSSSNKSRGGNAGYRGGGRGKVMKNVRKVGNNKGKTTKTEPESDSETSSSD